MNKNKSKRDIGIITMHRVTNFGSVLQAYALQCAIEKMGYKTEIIDYIYPNNFQESHKHKRWQTIIKEVIIRIFYIFFPYNRAAIKFRLFRRRYLKMSSTYKSYYSIHQSPPFYRLYITGSDQVWNAKFTKGDGTFLLDFASSAAKRISYAASFASETIDPIYRPMFAKFLSQYSDISVRETNSAKIVQSLIGSIPPVVVDPTLLLDKKEWQALISKYINQTHNDYILVYHLSYSFNNDPDIFVSQLTAHLHNVSKLPVIVIGQLQALQHKDYTTYIRDAGPIDFIRFMSGAKLIVTTSFHGTAFAINLEKDFYSVIDPQNGDDRISSLLASLGLTDRAIPIYSTPQQTYCKIDYTNVTIRLKNIKQRSVDFLSSAISRNI